MAWGVTKMWARPCWLRRTARQSRLSKDSNTSWVARPRPSNMALVCPPPKPSATSLHRPMAPAVAALVKKLYWMPLDSSCSTAMRAREKHRSMVS